MSRLLAASAGCHSAAGRARQQVPKSPRDRETQHDSRHTPRKRPTPGGVRRSPCYRASPLLESFDSQHLEMTLNCDVAPAASACTRLRPPHLITLQAPGFVGQNNKRFHLRRECLASPRRSIPTGSTSPAAGTQALGRSFRATRFRWPRFRADVLYIALTPSSGRQPSRVRGAIVIQRTPPRSVRVLLGRPVRQKSSKATSARSSRWRSPARRSSTRTNACPGRRDARNRTIHPVDHWITASTRAMPYRSAARRADQLGR